MSTLAHVLEEAGLATVALGIVRGQLESTAPPRGLFVDFPLGRPLGKPGDAEFQHRVLAHAFSMLERTEPGIEAFAEAIPDGCLMGVPADYSGVPMAVTRALTISPSYRFSMRNSDTPTLDYARHQATLTAAYQF